MTVCMIAAQRQDHRHEGQLPDLDTMIEEEKSDRNRHDVAVPLRRRAGKAKPVQQSEAEGNKPRTAQRRGGPSPPRIRDLDGHQHDAECDRRLDWRPGHTDEAERGRRERKAVGDGERRHRQCDAAPFANQNHQGQNEQQMIEAEQNVLDPRRR